MGHRPIVLSSQLCDFICAWKNVDRMTRNVEIELKALPRGGLSQDGLVNLADLRDATNGQQQRNYSPSKDKSEHGPLHI